MSLECWPATDGLWGEMSVLTGMAAQQADGRPKLIPGGCSDTSTDLSGTLRAAARDSPYTPRSRRHLLCSAATDGSIAFWDITGPVMDTVDALHQAEGEMQPLGECCCPAALPIPVTKVSIALLTEPVSPALEAPLVTVMAHSCGVNSLHIHETPEGRYLVASGSDDGSIHLCLLEVALGRGEAGAGTSLQVLERVSRPCAHAAHVTGIRVLRPGLLLSASVDQRLTLWKQCPGELVPLSTTFFHVPDLAELDCWEEVEAGGELQYYCVLCGQGLEMLCGTAPPNLLHKRLPSEGAGV